MPRESVVITGVGIVSPIGIGHSEFFDSLLAGRSGVTSLSERTDGDVVPSDEAAIDGVWVGAPVTDFQPKLYVRPRKALKVMCREIQTAFASAHLAVEHAGLADQIPASDEGAIHPRRLGTVYGSEIFFNPPDEVTAAIRACFDEDGQFHPGQFGTTARREIMPLWMLKYLPNMPACQVGISVNSQGPNNSLVLGDVSGPAALAEAESYLARGIADLMIVGATGTRIAATRLTYRGDYPLPRRGSYDVAEASRPHDPQAPGVVGGEGASSLIVETIEHAAARGARPLAYVLSTASRFCPTPAMRDQRRSSQPEPDASRQASDAIAASIAAVLTQSGVDPDQIGLVVSHAMGDRQADGGEADAIAKSGIACPLVAVASSIGHTGAASGMIGVAAGVLALAEKTIPPTRHDEVNPSVRFCDRPTPLGSPFVLCLSYTTEGSAMAVLLGERPL